MLEVWVNEVIEIKLNIIVILMICVKDDIVFDKFLEDYKVFLKLNKWDVIEKIKFEKMVENRDKFK